MFSQLPSRICHRILPVLHSKNVILFRSIHIIHKVKNSSLRNSAVSNQFIYKYSNVFTTSFIRHQSSESSTNENIIRIEDAMVDATPPPVSNITQKSTNVDYTADANDILPQIPDAPSIPLEDIPGKIINFHANGEPTFESIGLGGWSPSGMIQNCFEWLHIGCDLPWLTCIVIATGVVRLCLFPLVIRNQKFAARMQNVMPQMQLLQAKLSDARLSGDQYEAMKCSHDLMNFMKKNNVSPMQNMVTMFIQAPIFISFFWGLKGMADIPVESLKTGGLWWFTDLTLSDPYYILPLITSTTLLVTLELGTDTSSASTLGKMRYLLRGVPVIVFPMIMNFPAAILTYWASSNFISLIQVGILKIPKVRTTLGIPVTKKFKPKELPDQKNFIESIKETWTNLKISKQLADRERIDTLQFQQAAKGPVPKTYKYDPTKKVTTPTAKAILTKKKSY